MAISLPSFIALAMSGRHKDGGLQAATSITDSGQAHGRAKAAAAISDQSWRRRFASTDKQGPSDWDEP
ncbi:hypothetical protein QTL95_27740 [Rhizobium sp. S152]|uniref:hypothetical protein n=1 Tax=Rhizobium sp. S152 TaxID=3055038 RepID=UPI0025A98C6A|nr:hypothetical protein [Rhizobium sp. S152]MDM9629679.1 hypothetical protein [Rhizobium sp. S152]